MKIILASGSPRRKELLALAGYEFEVIVSEADEETGCKDPVKLVQELSYRKALATARYLHAQGKAENMLILGADTIVVYQNQILGKPIDREDACRMLSMLSGQTHQVYTGVTLLEMDGKDICARETFYECTDVMMREMSDREIKEYVDSGEPMDKAGAYGIQGKAAVFVAGIQGDYYNVVGLPVCRTVTTISRMVKESVPDGKE